ncbi:cytochrome c oxidase assembly protein [Amycolatopsis sp. NBC_01480]|nr:cytochrome c oxidase assembly protein [Amycolatopsis sp. NBC_01480]
MAQHLLLITVIPALIVLGQPLELLRRTSPPRHRRALSALRRNGLLAVLTHPLVALAVYAVVLVGTHLTPFMQVMLTTRGCTTPRPCSTSPAGTCSCFRCRRTNPSGGACRTCCAWRSCSSAW